MVAELLTGQPPSREFAELLRPEPLPDGTSPEQRLILCGVSWQRYLRLDKAMGDDRPGPRFYYLDGDLEIMTTSNEHERIKKWISGFIEDYLLHTGSETAPRGQATIRLAMKEAGAEPDESWCLGVEKEVPDLVLEIALTSGGVSKLELYCRFGVPEVWIWRRNALEIFSLRPDGSAYDGIHRSRLLPHFDVDLLERCVKIPSWREARLAFRAAMAKGS